MSRERIRAGAMALLVVSSMVVAGVGSLSGTASAHNSGVSVYNLSGTISGDEKATLRVTVNNNGNTQKEYTIEPAGVSGWSVSDNDYDFNDYRRIKVDAYSRKSVKFKVNPNGNSGTKDVKFKVWHKTKTDCGFLCTNTDYYGHWVGSDSDSVTADGNAPSISNVRTVIDGRKATVKADVSDANRIPKVDVTFNPDGVLNAETIEMTRQSGNTYAATKTLGWGTNFEYDVYAKDELGNSKETKDFQDSTETNDKPDISNVRLNIDGPKATVKADVTDSQGLSKVDVTFNPDGGLNAETIEMSRQSGNTYVGSKNLGWGTNFEYDIKATDDFGKSYETPDRSGSTETNDKPSISNVRSSIDGTTLTVTADVSDSQGVSKVDVTFNPSGVFNAETIEMTRDGGNTYSASKDFGWGTTVEYDVKATDEFEKSRETQDYTRSITDDNPPRFSNVDLRYNGKKVIVTADVSDGKSGLDQNSVNVVYDTGWANFGGTRVDMDRVSGATYRGSFSLDYGQRFEYKLTAKDNAGKTETTGTTEGEIPRGTAVFDVSNDDDEAKSVELRVDGNTQKTVDVPAGSSVSKSIEVDPVSHTFQIRYDEADRGKSFESSKSASVPQSGNQQISFSVPERLASEVALSCEGECTFGEYNTETERPTKRVNVNNVGGGSLSWSAESTSLEIVDQGNDYVVVKPPKEQDGSFSGTLTVTNDADRYEGDGQAKVSISGTAEGGVVNEAVGSILALEETYQNARKEQLNQDYWMDRQIEGVVKAFEALLPATPDTDTKEVQRTVAMEVLTQYGGKAAAEVADTLLTVPQVVLNVADSLRAGKIAVTLIKGGDSEYRQFQDSLERVSNNGDKLENVEKQLANAEGSERDELLEKRENLLEQRKKLLRAAYKDTRNYRYNVKESLTDNQQFMPQFLITLFGSDEATYDVVREMFKQTEKNLEADYYYTQIALNPDGTHRSIQTATGYAKPEYPTPQVVSVDRPKIVESGESFEITLKVKNSGAKPDTQTLNLGLKGATEDTGVEFVSTSIEDPSYAKIYDGDTELGAGYGGTTLDGASTVDVPYPVAEAAGQPGSGETETMTVRVTPGETGEFVFYAKTVAKKGAWNSDPGYDDGEKENVVQDAQEEYAYKYTVTVNGKPTAEAGDDETTSPGTSVTLDASGSSDDDGIQTYEWDVDSDGKYEISTPDPTATHTYSETGSRTVRLRVTDTDGATATDTLVVSVSDSDNPTANAGSDQTVSVGQTVTLDGSASTDSVGIETYEWDVDDDGEFERSGAKATATHTYEEPGTRTVTLRVADGADNTDTDTVKVTVEDQTSPKADAGSDTTVSVGSALRLDAGASSDNVGITTYEWDVDGDGEYELSTSEPTATHTYEGTGTRTLTLLVSDRAGNTATDTVVVSVEDSSNVPPGAAFDVDPEEPDPGEEVSFTSEATDADGTVESYEWEFGDGATASGQNPTHTYDEMGTYEVSLTVTDDDGGTNTVQKTVTVGSPNNEEPDASFTVDPTDPDTSDEITFTSTSSDIDGGIESYEWQFGDGTSATGETVTHTFDEATSYSVTLTVTDDDEGTDSTTETVTVDGVTESVDLSLSADRTSLTAGGDVEFTVTRSDTGEVVPATLYFGDKQVETGDDGVVVETFEDAGTYSVTANKTDTAVDYINDSVTVDVESEPSDEPSVTLTANESVGQPGGTASVEFNVTNNASDSGFILDVATLPDGFTVADQTPDGGTWKEADRSWLYQTVAQDTSVTPTLTLSVPSDAQGSYTVEAELLDSETVVATTSTTVSTCRGLAEAVDENDDGRIGDFEILTAISKWRSDEVVSGTCGETVGDFDVLSLIELWRNDTPVAEADL